MPKRPMAPREPLHRAVKIIETLRSRFGGLTTNGKPRFAVSGFTLAVCPYLGLKIRWLNSRLPCLFTFVRSLLF